jgi:hypothetical protein
MTAPPQTAMGDLVPLMYRGRWVRFGLSGADRFVTMMWFWLLLP